MANQQNAHAMGLQEGYSQEQWGPWKSHGLLLQQAISELSWQENAAALRKLFVEHSKSKEGYLSRDEFIAILQRYPCCNAAYHAVFFELFDRNSDGYLNECDFLGGVLAVSPLTPHKLEAPSGQLRMQFIFLYYDANRNGRLEVEEVAMMIEHIQQLRGNPHSDAMVDATALVSLYSGPFGFAAFYDAAQKRMLNGTSPLLRTQQDLLEAIWQKQGNSPPPAQPSPCPTQSSTQTPGQQGAQQLVGRQQSAPTSPSVPGQSWPELPVETTSPSNGHSNFGHRPTSSPAQSWPELPVETTSPSNGHNSFGHRPSPSAQSWPELPVETTNPSNGHNNFGHRQSSFSMAGGQAGPRANHDDPLNHLGAGQAATPPLMGPRFAQELHVVPPPPASALRAGPTGPCAPTEYMCWPNNDPHGKGGQTLALRVVRRLMELSNGPRTDWRHTLQLVTSREMLLLCDTVVEVLRQEDSLVQVALPCRVYGDIHGQLLDLLEFFNAFSWPDKRRGDIFSMNYIFLGDFVDRGAYSCDVISLLFSLKILYPNKIFLVRGNHEDRLMNINYGFQADCVRKFVHDGEDVWERINDVFEFLPITALVEGAILCIHGGIGDSINSLDDLRGIPKPIQVVGEINSSTTRQDRMILDALWSDPTDNDSVLGVHVSPRGKNTCRFGPDRVQDFNRRNGLKLIIRAHECVQHGYEYFAGGQLLTVFSATNYCNQYNNDGAMVVLVKDDRTGEVVEHAQVIKSGTVDTSHGWNDQQFRAPSPMRRATAVESGSFDAQQGWH